MRYGITLGGSKQHVAYGKAGKLVQHVPYATRLLVISFKEQPQRSWRDTDMQCPKREKGSRYEPHASLVIILFVIFFREEHHAVFQKAVL